MGLLKNISLHSMAIAMSLALSMLFPRQVAALPLDKYAESSVLSDGYWVKISVSESGMHMISASQLRQWGFSEPSKVHVYGYGGKRLSDRLTEAEVIDDLPLVQSVFTSRGLMFYAVGTTTWKPVGDNYAHSQNPYSTVGYYFLSDKETEDAEMPNVDVDLPVDVSFVESFTDRLFHEKDLVSPGETGHLLVGEDFKYSSSQSFTFSLPDNCGDEVWLRCSFVTKTYSTPSTLTFTVNGAQLPEGGTETVKASANNAYTHGSEGVIDKTLAMSGDKLTLGLIHKSPVTVHRANLNYLTLNYTRRLVLRDGKLDFRTSNDAVRLSGATVDTHVWDVTDPLNVKNIKTQEAVGAVVFKNEYHGEREYSAWNENGEFPSPLYVDKILNQNLHVLETPDMVIFTVSKWRDQAERIADYHRASSDSLSVLVVNQDAVFNEFASGSPDANAFRRMLKMLWDRGGGANGSRLKYALFMGRGVYDNRLVTSVGRSLEYPTMPIWQTDGGLSDNDSYSTDDVYGFLKDGSGLSMSTDKMMIAVGRMPVRTTEEAKAAVDKLLKYTNSSPSGSWKNQLLLVADDDDNGVHMTQTEMMYSNFVLSQSGGNFFYNKLFADVFEKTNNQYPEAKERMLKILDEGVLWWNYIGHANTSSLAHEGLLTYEDITNLYLKRLPIMYAATCEFMRWDAPGVSGAEVMFHNPNGGVIAAISAVRPVYIADNGTLSSYLSSVALTRDKNGNFYPLGEVLRLTKGKFNKANSNKLRYALMGDPAMRYVTPSNVVVLESIDGSAVDLDDQITLKARQNAVLKGAVYAANGVKLSGLNGTVEVRLYDAEKSTTTRGQGDNGLAVTFDEQGSLLCVCRDSVVNGEFEIKLSMPSEIAFNFRPAALNMYVTSASGVEAVGCNREFYVYGYDETVPVDTVPPLITSHYLNHETFRSGDVVNESPMVIASVSDNVGINLSTAGIGHQMSLTIDGVDTYGDVSQYYFPDATGESAGTITYPLEGLDEGAHTMRLRVWDTSGNAAESTLEFVVQKGLAPQVYDVYSDANPASAEANFYISHNRPDAMVTVTVEVYNLIGSKVWSATQTGRSDMFKTFPITWNLTDGAGRRVQRGIYLYKASISTDGENYATESKRIAVTAK